MKEPMSVATFDTLAAVRNLEKAGMGTSQAEAVAETIRVAVFQGVASKEDIGELRAEMKAETADLRAEMGGLRAEMGGLRAGLRAEIGELRSATQADNTRLRAGTKADIGALRVELEKFRADMTWRMVIIMVGVLGLFTALDLFFLN